MPHTVLIAATTDWPSAARFAAAFAWADCRVEAVAPANAPVRQSRFVAYSHPYSAFAPTAGFEQAIRAAQPALIVPCDDRAVACLVRLHREAQRSGDVGLAATLARSLGRPELYDGIADRAGFIAAAGEDGIAVPATRLARDETEFERGLAELGLPLVLKLDGSWGGDGVVIAHDREQARAAFRRLSRPLSLWRAGLRSLRRGDLHCLTAALGNGRPRVSLQAFIAGAPATTALAAWQGEVLAMSHCDVMAGAGGTGPASVLRPVEDAAMAEAAIRLARRFGLSGLHGLDFIRDRDGKVHLLELNPRATQSAALALGEGRDLPAALAGRALGHAVPCRPALSQSATVALFPQEWRRDPSSVWLRDGHHDVPWDDPAVVRYCLKGVPAQLWAGLQGPRPAAAAPAPVLPPALAQVAIPASAH